MSLNILFVFFRLPLNSAPMCIFRHQTLIKAAPSVGAGEKNRRLTYTKKNSRQSTLNEFINIHSTEVCRQSYYGGGLQVPTGALALSGQVQHGQQ